MTMLLKETKRKLSVCITSPSVGQHLPLLTKWGQVRRRELSGCNTITTTRLTHTLTQCLSPRLCSISQFRSTGVSTALTTKRWTWSPSSGQWDRPSTRTWWWGPSRQWTSTPWCATSWASSRRSTTATWTPPSTCWLAALLLLRVSSYQTNESLPVDPKYVAPTPAPALLGHSSIISHVSSSDRGCCSLESGSVLVVRLEMFYGKELKNTDVRSEIITGDSYSDTFRQKTVSPLNKWKGSEKFCFLLCLRWKFELYAKCLHWTGCSRRISCHSVCCGHAPASVQEQASEQKVKNDEKLPFNHQTV